MKMYSIDTGGGPASTSEIDPVMEAVLWVINKITVVGHTSPFDCDAQQSNEEVLWTTELHEIEEVENTNVAVTEVVGSQMKTISSRQNLKRSICDTNIISDQSMEKIEICNQQNENQQPSMSNDPPDNHKQVKLSADNNWSTYTPNKLKTPISKKLRPMALNPLKEEYYKKKIKLIEEETRRSILQQEEITSRKLREEEQHEKQIKLLDLEMKIKEKM